MITIQRPNIDRFTTQQHISALSQRNRQDFLERMGAAEPVVEELAKVEPSTWREMKGIFNSMEQVGRMNMFGNFTGRMQQAAMFPMNVMFNRVGFMLEQLFLPMMPLINKVTIAYENFVMSNQTGALIGGGIGMIVGLYLPGGPILWGIIGSTVGAGIEESLTHFEAFTEAGGRVFPFKAPSTATPFDPLGGAGGGGTPAGTIVQDPELTPIRISTAERAIGRFGRLRLI